MGAPSTTATEVNDADDAGAQAGRRRRKGSGHSRTRPEQRGDQGESVDDGDDTFEVPVEEQARTAEEFTRGLVESFGTGATVSSRIEDASVEIEIEGGQLGLFVGPRGTTLAAIEELVRTVVQRHTGGHGVRIHVDVGGYRAKRREALSEFTRDLARKVLENGREQALEPMAAPDRKVVHDTVAEIEGVTTVSEGEEPRRRVVIRRA